MDGAVEVWTVGGLRCHVRALVSKEVVSAGAAAGSRFGEVGGVTLYVEDHISCRVTYLGVWVCDGVVEQPEGVGVCFLRAFLFLRGDETESGEHSWAHCY